MTTPGILYYGRVCLVNNIYLKIKEEIFLVSTLPYQTVPGNLYLNLII
jgi:hypothetical protein